jgi:formamidase
MTTRELRINAELPLAQEPSTGHNRWHPAIAPALDCDPGDHVILETRDAFDGQMGPSATLESVRAPNLNLVHPLTGPVYINGAEPGDIVEAEILEVEPDAYGFTIQVPGFGFLRDAFPEPFIVKWQIAHNVAESSELPGIRVQGAPFMGTIGVAPDRELLEALTVREAASRDRGGFVLPPDPADAIPSDPAIAAEALRTIPPRETAGNVDIRQLTAGTRLYLPAFVEGALFSAGDAHFAQGDGEVCGTAIEIRAALNVRFQLHKGAAAKLRSGSIHFEGDSSRTPSSPTDSGRFYATTGMSVTADGTVQAEDLTLAARNAVLSMIEYLTSCGWSDQEAYAIASVAVDLKVSELVDVPNYVVTAFLPLGIFADGNPRRP